MIMSIGGIYMVSDKIKQIMKMKKVTSIQLAQHLGMLPQSLANKFSRGSISADELIQILDFLECQLIIEPKPDVSIKLTTDDLKREP
jgi:DNA-binding Xre family transcriptional regulator